MGAALATPATSVTLNLEPRERRGRAVRALRRAGQLPAVVYGHKVDAVSVAVDGREFLKAFQKVGRNQLLDLQIGSEPVRKALVREVQRSPRHGDLLHVDFYQVNLTEKIESEIPIEFEGEIEIVAKGEADLLRGLHQLRVEALPTDLPPVISVDISGLKEVDDEIRVKDLKLPAGVEALDDPEDLIVKVHEHREEVEEAPAPAAAAEVPTVAETEGAPGAEAPAEGTETQG
ncbi:MAG TPA: 50S ribosomal protein L25 [Candidatus Limnocylindrales bacterium]|nr:50S ribosomal protein L25 [Candidatus Limnocylindrales bacterium]